MLETAYWKRYFFLFVCFFVLFFLFDLQGTPCSRLQNLQSWWEWNPSLPKFNQFPPLLNDSFLADRTLSKLKCSLPDAPLGLFLLKPRLPVVADSPGSAPLPLATPLHSVGLFKMPCPNTSPALPSVSCLSLSPFLSPSPRTPPSVCAASPPPRPRTTPLPPELRLPGVRLSSAWPEPRLLASARHVSWLWPALSPSLPEPRLLGCPAPLGLQLLVGSTSWPRPRDAPFRALPPGFAARLAPRPAPPPAPPRSSHTFSVRRSPRTPAGPAPGPSPL
ncbi:F-box/LRR-repeat protein 12 isoform X4 [Onychomys torridus]|uniref:F-box/LRR-repeat protein 12 isoform X4 n=1 Tax=Onychomys torridus TaxID=38674 RepID=UPI00167F292C|nr:F-box/LRR-repeat protein 12 isoform X4 [Onychomys torridus]